MWYWDGKQWAIPFMWGADQIILNPEMAEVEVKDYPDLLDPSFTGKVAIIDNPLTVWPQLAKLAGYGDKFPNMTKEELADCFAKNKPYRDQMKVFATSNGDVICSSPIARYRPCSPPGRAFRWRPPSRT